MAKRYQRDNQKPKDRQHHSQKIPKGYSEDEGQTAPWPKDTKGVIRIHISKKNRNHNGQAKRYL
jgi:hypothetical protein